MADYPNSIFSPRVVADKSGVVYNALKTTIPFAKDKNDADAEIVAIETELGTLPKGTSASVKERLKGIRSLSDANADVLVVKGGNVGIGTTGPNEILSIKNPLTTVGGVYPIVTSQWGTTTVGGLYSTYDHLNSDALGQGLAFKIYQRNVGLAEVMRINGETGNVGIGTTGPLVKLEVGSSASTRFAVTTTGAAGSFASLVAEDGLNRSYLVIKDSGTLRIGHGSDIIGSSFTDRLTIGGTGIVTIAQNLVVSGTGNTTIAGNVGIGITAPTAVLHLKAGTATANTAPLKFTAGVLNTTPVIGCVEFVDDATNGHLYITLNVGGVLTRKEIALVA